LTPTAVGLRYAIAMTDIWEQLPDNLLIDIFKHLHTAELCTVAKYVFVEFILNKTIHGIAYYRPRPTLF